MKKNPEPQDSERQNGLASVRNVQSVLRCTLVSLPSSVHYSFAERLWELLAFFTHLFLSLSNYHVHQSVMAFIIVQGGDFLIPTDYIPIWIFFINYLPTIVITLVNNVIPAIFDLFAQWEDRQPRTELKLKLFRLVILRISALCKYWGTYWVFIGKMANCWDFWSEICKTSIWCFLFTPGVLLWSIKNQIDCDDPDECGRCEPVHAFNDDSTSTPSPRSEGNKIMCWETYLGQQMWRIIIADFLANFLVAFVMEPTRNFIGTYKQKKTAYLSPLTC